jgi:hypothetical protein
VVLGIFCRCIAGLMLASTSWCTLLAELREFSRVAEFTSVVLKGKVQQHVESEGKGLPQQV